ILEIHNDVGHGNSIMTCQEMQNPDAIQGASIDGAIVDEAPQVTNPLSWEQLFYRLRGSERNPRDLVTKKPIWPIKFGWAGNPRPGFCHREFVRPFERGELGVKPEYKRRAFIPA